MLRLRFFESCLLVVRPLYHQAYHQGLIQVNCDKLSRENNFLARVSRKPEAGVTIMLENKYDVIVCGGGTAGIAAALSAARAGASTLLLEREYALGGLATLGQIVIYLPLCDGDGVQMSGGLAEELLKLTIRYGPGEIPPLWRDPQSSREERAAGPRYRIQYQSAPFMLAAEEAILGAGVDLLYSAQVAGAVVQGDQVQGVIIETKRGRRQLAGRCFIDATGDADLLFFAGERTYDDPTNRRTGWYFSYNGKDVKLHQQTDPIDSAIPADSRLYSGTDIEDVSQHCIDMHRMILAHNLRLRSEQDQDAYPLLIPAFHGLRMTRRLDGVFAFSEDLHEGIWFEDAIGMIGNWKKHGCRYTLPYRTICAPSLRNLYAAGRCTGADKSGWDLTRVIPSCAVTGEAAGLAAALQVKLGQRPSFATLQEKLVEQGVLLDETLFRMKQRISDAL